MGCQHFSYSYFIVSCDQGVIGHGLISHFLCGCGQFCVIINFIIVFIIILFPGVIVQDGISIQLDRMSFDVGFLCHCQWFWVMMGGNANADLGCCVESIEDVMGGLRN